MRVLIVDDHPIYAEGLRNLLCSRDYRDIQVATGGEEAVELARSWRPDVVLMDIAMPGMGGIRATELIKAENADAKIVMLTSFGDDESLVEAVKAGASGYVVKSVRGDELIACLEELGHGKSPFSAGLEDVLLAELRKTADIGVHGRVKLDRKAGSILDLLAQDLTYKEIGAKLFLSERTIKYHVERIKAELGLDSRTALVEYWRTRRSGDARPPCG